MGLINSIVTWVMKKRIHQIELFMKYPEEVQEELLRNLISSARNTEFGQRFDFPTISSYQQFTARVPVRTYEEIYPDIERIMRGEQNVLWPGEIRWFSKSSGTTNARSKFIPVTEEALEDCHFKGGKDLISIFVNNYPETKLFDGKGLAVGGSHQINQFDPTQNSFVGDVSAVIMQNLPEWAQFIRTPSLDTALLNNWEEKIEKMAVETASVNVTHIAGVPTWTILVIQRIVELRGKNNILEIWPNLEAFFHGAVAFGPYRNLFRSLIPTERMVYWEVYNASEGFFGIQDQKNNEDLLLMLDYGIFYEFIPVEDLGSSNPKILPLGEVELHRQYAMVITTNAGLWRYLIGDTVRFTSIRPYRIRISGRTKHFINAFGEEVIVENADEAIAQACLATEAIVENYTAAPVYLEEGKRGRHEWIIEFRRSPENLDQFSAVLDNHLRKCNSDYDAKRQNDLALISPLVRQAKSGVFYEWLKMKGKLGGQHKVPRLSNSRELIEELYPLL